MKLKILILFTIILFLPHFLNAQNLKINQTFKADTLLNIFNNEIIGSIKISAKVLLNNENSLIRVILVDSNSSEWLIAKRIPSFKRRWNPLSQNNENL